MPIDILPTAPEQDALADDAATLPPADGLYGSQWYLHNTLGPDLNITSVWPDYTGAGVSVAIIDDGFDLTHADLAANFDTARDFDYYASDSTPASEGNPHGTAVAGVIGAANNGTGTVGVAYDATLVGLRVSFSGNVAQSVFDNALAAMKDFDVVNNSWGYTTPFADNFCDENFSNFRTDLVNAAMTGRHGLGTVVVFAAGNTGAAGDNTNYHSLQNSPYEITVGAIQSSGASASFSTPGASVLVSAPGESIVTTDVTGASGYVAGDYVTHSGTSFAAPMVSAIAALMLEANPDLGYRDVQEILAYSARKTGPSSVVWTTNGANNLNGGGLHFNDAYGFGLVDAHAAVRLAETWTAQRAASNMFTISQVSNGVPPIPDGSTFAEDSIHISTDAIIDHVLVNANILHADISQLRLELISPTGTVSTLMANPVSSSSFPVFTFDTVKDWGEHAAGDWKLRIYDTVSGTAGSLAGWTLTILGDAVSNDDTYIYTDENKGLIKPLDANSGIDTINAAALSHATSLDLALQPTIENLFTGDGADFVHGNADNNIIKTGRGDDTIQNSGGNDTIDGGAGTDTFMSDNVFNHAITVNGDNDITLTSLIDGTSTRLENIETFSFAGVSYDLPGLLAAARSGTLTDVIYFVHGAAGIAQGHSDANGSFAYTAADLGIGGQGVVLLAERDFDHLTLTNDAGPDLKAITMRMDDGLNLTVRGFNQVDLVADGTHATSIDIGGGQRGFIQTGSGNDTVNFTAFLIDRFAPAQERTLTASTNDGNDTVTIDDRSSYLAYDVNLGAGNDTFFAKGSQGGHILGGAGADTFGFGHNNGDATGIYDFNSGEGDRLDLSQLLETHNVHQDAIADFIQLSTNGGNTTIKVDNAAVVTLYGTTLSDSVQHYIDTGLIVTHD